ncbi:MAG: hypothetical protein R2911_25060 [Caldilineaceae bacterium]
MAAISQPAGVGRFRHWHLRHRVVMFWFIGLILIWPPCATARPTPLCATYGVLALGWRGPPTTGSATMRPIHAGGAGHAAGGFGPLGGELDLPWARHSGWHSTVFPPYFVGGAIFSGFAMLTLLIPLRKIYHLKTLSPCAIWTTWPR